MQRPGTTLKTALIFCSGTLLGVGSVRALDRFEAHAEPAEQVVPVRGVEAALDKTAAPVELPARDDAPKASEKEAASRVVARAALATTVGIRGDGVYGAGIVISAQHVLTCLHVVEKMKAIRVTAPDGEVTGAEIVDRDARLDLAVLELDQPRETHARLATVASLEMGDPVFAMGSPRKMSFSLASGIVSYVGRPYSDLFYLQNDIPTNGGSSGGPVFDELGRVIGVASFILRDSQGLAFALPIDYAFQRFPDYFASRLSTPAFVAWLGARAATASADERPPLTE